MADSIFSINRIRGFNDTDPPTTIGEDQCVYARNVEFDKSALGERRLGCDNITLPSSITGNANIQAITFLHRHLPTTDETAAELWVMGQHLTTQNVVLTRKTTSWTDATVSDTIDVTSNRGFEVSAQTLHGKLFLAYRTVGGTDRLHVVDQSGTTVRRCGLAEPAAPSVADTGTPGTVYSGKRYFRVRYTVQSSGVTIRRSEPSDATTFTPSGSGTAARITKPATISESETHWEVEASLNNSDFFRIATVAVGTTTYDDSTAFNTGYAANTLSEDTGDYALIRSGKYLAADEDRLLIGGSWEDDDYASTVSWTPVFNADGVGNDERHETDTDPHLALDNFEGGPLTGLSNPVAGFLWATKRSHIYRLRRTNNRVKAYEADKVSDSIGALPGSLVQGVDQFGQPCLYGLDPRIGPWRTGGPRLITSCGRDILTTWRTVKPNAIIACRGVFYPDSRQVHWWIATSSSDYPNLKIVLQTNHTREMEDGVRNGWATADGTIAAAYSVCLFSSNIEDNTTRNLTLRPFIGVSSSNGYVLRCDTGNDDNGTAYSARIVTRPYILRSILGKFKVLAAAILAVVHATADLNVTVIRDFGLEEPRTVEIDFAASASETQVVKQLRSLVAAQLYALQVEFEDVASPSGQWQLNRMDMRITPEESA